jgi:hypothetical protein
MVSVSCLKIASKREQSQACLNYAEHEQFQVPCLKNARERRMAPCLALKSVKKN